jgi:iron complex outermembrane recepter protein
MKKTNFTLKFILINVLFINFLSAQEVVKGTLFDSKTKEPIVGGSVLQKGTLNGTTSDFDGNFSLEVDKLPVVLNFSFLGYEKKEIEVKESKNLSVALVSSEQSINEVIVTSRRRNEEVLDIPIPIAVLSAKEIDNSVSFNVNRVKELVPSVQLYSSNPRNTTINIRGVGSTFGLTNDGIDPGVGFYVDGVYYARPAATTLDFIDIQQIEVLRGPQGTLFGKNTTAGTFNITTKKPTFFTSGNFELSFGNYGFIQTKASLSGPIIKDKLAARVSFTGTHRDGNIYNVRTEKYTNTLNNQGVRAQFLYTPNDKIDVLLAADYTRQRPDGYAQVVAGVAPTERAEFRQFENIIADLGYDLPSRNPFDRLIDHDTPWRSDQDMGGVSLNADFKIWKGTLTATSAWRTWLWGPSNDRDFTGLQALALSQAPSIHHQWTQEVRYAGDFTEKLSGVIGAFAFYQKLDADGAHREESGRDQWRFVQNNQNPLWQTPGLLEGYGITTKPSFRNFSGAVFGQVDWKITDRLTFLPGFRLNYDQKEVDFSRETYGGLQTDDPELRALQRSVYSDLAFTANTNDFNASGQLTLSYRIHQKVRAFATYSLGFKPVGLNLGGIPTENGEPLIDLAVIKPERVNHYELGFKTEPFKNAILNLTGFYTDINDYQTNVRSAELGVNRGYLANAERVRVAGAEIEASYFFPKYFRLNSSISYTDGKYVLFRNAPVPLEETGGALYKDISGENLPGISNWIVAGGGEVFKEGRVFGQEGEFFLAADLYYRSGFSSSPSASRYLNVDGYALLNARIGFRSSQGFTFFIWSRNLANKDYFEQLLPAGGNAGHYAGVLGDPRTFGATLRYNFSK